MKLRSFETPGVPIDSIGWNCEQHMYPFLYVGMSDEEFELMKLILILPCPAVQGESITAHTDDSNDDNRGVAFSITSDSNVNTQLLPDQKHDIAAAINVNKMTIMNHLEFFI